MAGQKPILDSVITAPESNRHKRPWGDHSRTMMVRLDTPDPAGEWMDGMFRIPASLANTEPHTNERHRLDNIIRDAFNRWVQMKRMLGWKWDGKRPLLSEPFDPPQVGGNARAKQFIERAARNLPRIGTGEHHYDEEDPDSYKCVMFRARFQRTLPLYLKLDDALARRELAAKFGVDLGKDFEPVTSDREQLLEGGDSGWVKPLELAEERRRRLGIDRRDYIIGPHSDWRENLMEPL